MVRRTAFLKNSTNTKIIVFCQYQTTFQPWYQSQGVDKRKESMYGRQILCIRCILFYAGEKVISLVFIISKSKTLTEADVARYVQSQ